MGIDLKNFKKGSQSLKATDIVAGELYEISEIDQIETKYGDKLVCKFKNGKSVFINNMSLTNLEEAYGDDTDSWIGKSVALETEISERTQGKKAIVIVAQSE